MDVCTTLDGNHVPTGETPRVTPVHWRFLSSYYQSETAGQPRSKKVRKSLSGFATTRRSIAPAYPVHGGRREEDGKRESTVFRSSFLLPPSSVFLSLQFVALPIKVLLRSFRVP